jgi:hypothetical protein
MIYKYQRFTIPGPNGTTYYYRNSESEPRALELAELAGWYYVHVPEGCQLPEQPIEIHWTAVELTSELREQLKAQGRPAQLIAQAVIDRIRVKYPLDEELYFARIAVGALQGSYTLLPGEAEALTQYQIDVEAAREWGRQQRANIGL